jgi:uncharacterized DUF497 family protein
LRRVGREWRLRARQFQFEWDEVKAAANLRKHDVPFDLASTVFNDPFMLTIADLTHSDFEERWFSVGRARTGIMLSVSYLWVEADPSLIKIRIISARRSTRPEIRHYEESL